MDVPSLVWAGVILGTILVLAARSRRRRPFRPSMTIDDAPRGRGRLIVGGDFVAAATVRRRQARPFALKQTPRLRPLAPRPGIEMPENVRPIRAARGEELQ